MREKWLTLHDAVTVLAARAVMARNWAMVRELEGVAQVAIYGYHGHSWVKWMPQYDGILQQVPSPTEGEVRKARVILAENAATRRAITKARRAERRAAALRPYKQEEEARAEAARKKEGAAISALYTIADRVEKGEVSPEEALTQVRDHLTYLGFVNPDVAGVHRYHVAESFRRCAKVGRRPGVGRMDYLWRQRLRRPESGWIAS